MKEIEILYEDEEILVVNKPSGLVVHSDGKTEEKSLADWILENHPEMKDIGEPAKTPSGKIIPRPGIVHRLDRGTSGVMVVAKTQNSFDNLKKQFQNHKTKKEYHAFVFGEMKNDNGVIDRPITRSSSDFRKWSAQRGGRGEAREAITEYSVIHRNKNYSFIYAFPKTGRTHQIRVHFKAINHPLVEDSLYAPNRDNDLGFKRLALHSFSISFFNIKGENMLFSAPHPEDFIKGLQILEK